MALSSHLRRTGSTAVKSLRPNRAPCSAIIVPANAAPTGRVSNPKPLPQLHAAKVLTNSQVLGCGGQHVQKYRVTGRLETSLTQQHDAKVDGQPRAEGIHDGCQDGGDPLQRNVLALCAQSWQLPIKLSAPGWQPCRNAGSCPLAGSIAGRRRGGSRGEHHLRPCGHPGAAAARS